MDIGQLCSILAACISQNPQQRKAAEVTLAQVMVGNMHVYTLVLLDLSLWLQDPRCWDHTLPHHRVKFRQ
jgi:hypothetical protein